jgi:oligoendopeptidase F
MDLGFNRHSPMEFAEVASMSMERLGSKYLDAFYDNRSIARALAMEYEEILRLLPWIATVDAFQHWLYSHPKHTHEERQAYWVELDERFGPALDWSGFEEYRKVFWQKQLHIFEYPFYYIEYGIAQIGALQIWARSLDNEQAAIADYRAALKLGGTKGVKALFGKAGIQFDMGPKVMEPLVGKLWKALQSAQREIEGA